ncbi:glutathionylspermidine synthase family protein, partial [Escherichia coli]|uniref:glutathionylspermidine synthase family protein n=1 Tax=Escherichia coli TaxID=562 RepID=UPI0013B3CB62
MLEPAWKLVLSNKGILPILWELYPDHPNLLPTYWDSSKFGSTYVRKPLLSREGADVTIVRDGVEGATLKKGYGTEGYIYQQYLDLPKFDGYTPIIGSWMVGGRSCGMG